MMQENCYRHNCVKSFWLYPNHNAGLKCWGQSSQEVLLTYWCSQDNLVNICFVIHLNISPDMCKVLEVRGRINITFFWVYCNHFLAGISLSHLLICKMNITKYSSRLLKVKFLKSCEGKMKILKITFLLAVISLLEELQNSIIIGYAEDEGISRRQFVLSNWRSNN